MVTLVYFSYAYTVAILIFALLIVQRAGWNPYLLGITGATEVSRIGHILFLSQNLRPLSASPPSDAAFDKAGIYIILLSSLISGVLGLIVHQKRISPLALGIILLCALNLITAFYLWMMS